ncbi:MAG: peptidylprolyl isomerase [Bacillota bacterium]|nr:peptidylprolyl isomerase [Bacillota bacterium]
MVLTQMRKSVKVIVYVVVVAFAASLLYVGYSGRLPVGGAALGAPIAVVNGEKISAQEFTELYLQIVSLQEASGRSVPESQVEALKAQLLNQMVNGKLVLQAARQEKIKVTKDELKKAYDEYAKQYPSEQAFREALKQRNLTVREFRERLRNQKLVEKMVEQVQESAKISEADLAKAYEQVHARHILFRVENPEEDAAVRAKAEETVKKLRAGADFAQLAKKLSDDPGSKDKGGDLGFFGHGQMVAEFEKVAFDLKVNEFSDPVKTAYGYHIIQVLDRKEAKGVEFEKAKEDLRKRVAESEGQKAFNEWFTGLRKKAKIEIKDAQLAAYNAAAEGDLAKAKQLYQEALKKQPQNGYLYGDLARIAEQEKKPEEALKYYELAAKYAPGEAIFHFSLGELYQQKNELEKAVAAYQKASDLEPKNFYLHYALMSVFKEMKRTDLAKKEEEKLNAIVEASQQSQQGQSGLPSGHPPVPGNEAQSQNKK